MSIDRNKIIKLYLNLNEFNKQLLSISITDAMKPLVYNLKCIDLNCLFDDYLDMLWDLKPVEKSLVSDFEKKTDVFFYHQEFDEMSFSSYSEPNFILYLAYMGKESLRYCLERDKDIYGRININSFIDVNKILDDYYYHMYMKNSMGHKLEFILNQVSERKFEYSCINMLETIIELCNHLNNGSKKNVRNYIDLYTSNIGSIFNLKV